MKQPCPRQEIPPSTVANL